MGAENSPWGMVVHYPDKALIDILKQGRVGWLRTEVYFSNQPAPYTRPRWDDVVAKVDAAYSPPAQEVYFGINPGYPGWIARGGPRPEGGDEDVGIGPRRRQPGAHRDPPAPTEADIQNWQARYTHWEWFVGEVVREFGRRGVRYFNIGNEPNDIYGTFFRFGKEEYLNLLVIAARVIHAAGYKVCAPDIATGDEHYPKEFLRACFARLRAENQRLDVVSIHGYCGRKDSVQDFVNKLAGVVLDPVREYGVSAPIWLTETGVSNEHFPDDPQKNANRVRDICRHVGQEPSPIRPDRTFLRKVFFYVWSDDAVDGGKYAWLTPDKRPIPHLWDAYKSMTGGT